MKIILVLAFFLPASFLEAGYITIIKHTPLSPSINTEDIEKSKRLAQFAIQKDVYNKIVSIVEGKRSKMLISEGCHGKIDRHYKKTHNGWNYSKLYNLKNNSSYEDILAPTSLKVKARYDNLKVVCGTQERPIDVLAIDNIDQNPIIVIPGGQVESLMEKFKDKGIPTRVISSKINGTL